MSLMASTDGVLIEAALFAADLGMENHLHSRSKEFLVDWSSPWRMASAT